ncbi:MAG: [Fe-Fe] hydrogenase large subunit C-terminal domain-containing protein [Spirochaetia bacterium]|nr:[Fe-Fe] hydrogenase large subunit C-terminal domain-containing protein [Spirochaetia bacterium]
MQPDAGQPIFHSITLDSAKCVGCTTCMRFCPTEAIRVRSGRAIITAERCVDCGECMRVCPHGAKKAFTDSLEAIHAFPIRVAIPAPTLYGQFDERFDVDCILSGLLSLGFTDVLEVAWAAEWVGATARTWIDSSNDPGPWISSACPAVVNLLQVRFPSLLDRLVPVLSPMEAAARYVKETLYPGRSDVGVFFISPCAGKMTASRRPYGVEVSAVDGVIGIKDVYVPLLNALPGLQARPLRRAGPGGLAWARADGESESIGQASSISVCGIDHVAGIFEAMENGTLMAPIFIEALACRAGCVGGPLTVENPYIARARIKSRERMALPCPPLHAPTLEPMQEPAREPGNESDPEPLCLTWSQPVKARPALRLDADMTKAMAVMEKMEEVAATLPGLDCGSCGAPNCKAFAEDVARGDAVITDCILKLRERYQELAGTSGSA